MEKFEFYFVIFHKQKMVSESNKRSTAEKGTEKRSRKGNSREKM